MHKGEVLMPWDPDRYQQFHRERAAPFDDLLAMIHRRERMRVIDLGCGPGELTLRLSDELPGSDIVGLDSSAEMLDRTRQYTRPGLRFELGSLLDVEGAWDLVFSHATIQWIDDHRTLIPRLLGLVRPGGQLAVQLPANHEHPSQVLIRQVAAQEPFRSALGGWSRHSPVLPVEEYAELLYEHGGRDLTVLLKVYPHELANAGAIADWVAGTVLVPYFERLGDLQEMFMERYRETLREYWPKSPVFYGFRRILFVATKPVR